MSLSFGIYPVKVLSTSPGLLTFFLFGMIGGQLMGTFAQSEQSRPVGHKFSFKAVIIAVP